MSLRFSDASPGGAALIMDKPTAGGLTLGSSCRLIGGNQPGLLYYTLPVFPSSASISGSPGPVILSTFPAATELSVNFIFAVPNERELSLLADEVIRSTSDLKTAALNGLSFVDATKMGGTVTFDATTHVLSGSGILYVKGNLVVPAGTSAVYSGVIIVTGNVDITAPASINGSVIVFQGGKVNLHFSSEGVEIAYDPDVIQRVRNDLLQYRQYKAGLHVYKGRGL